MSDTWSRLRSVTQARIGLGRAGHALPTSDQLELQLAQARARAAVWKPWDLEALATRLRARGPEPLRARSCISERGDYLKRPDRGRKLAPESRAQLEKAGCWDLAFLVSDGLSAQAVDSHFLPLWNELLPRLQKLGLWHSPPVLVPFARVAISDDVGQALGARIAVIFIGERPGQTASDSLGAYLTYAPRPGGNDAGRNCLSNIRPPQGLSYELAASRLVQLITESLRLGLSGVALKEDGAQSLPDHKA